ncbi:hypothetical protein Afil01_65490 [Actinorhabdospora filicis]|uniref:Putative restriction endonuclease domain-containing protein n=1 Tax=Actinorhabdospora filicis TaxID=1785913 RepID=A0A9W6W6N4_9ACTN|nr:Uma2 family endonuclease [Actinorhabdospora filicis]GLZ81742.1 hypothetical protein Afil01_65490 [Actinorhabdospora filicis]
MEMRARADEGVEDAPAEGTILKTFFDISDMTPPGYQAELITERIVVNPPPSAAHESNYDEIDEQIRQHHPRVYRLSGNTGLITPLGRFIPDLTVSPKGTLRGPETWSPPTEVELVAEITSPSGRNEDLGIKRRGYAQAGIPIYLLIDRKERTVILYDLPKDHDYTQKRTVKFGDPLPLPEPFAFTLETADFV